ncbi:MAG: hypothetical protein LBU15_00225 [Rickettsiales bacterium]|jgi:hypothetical protein|nr:hypothetical protein [Rickettsiales bacterium]
MEVYRELVGARARFSAQWVVLVTLAWVCVFSKNILLCREAEGASIGWPSEFSPARGDRGGKVEEEATGGPGNCEQLDGKTAGRRRLPGANRSALQGAFSVFQVPMPETAKESEVDKFQRGKESEGQSENFGSRGTCCDKFEIAGEPELAREETADSGNVPEEGQAIYPTPEARGNSSRQQNDPENARAAGVARYIPPDSRDRTDNGPQRERGHGGCGEYKISTGDRGEIGLSLEEDPTSPNGFSPLERKIDNLIGETSLFFVTRGGAYSGFTEEKIYSYFSKTINSDVGRITSALTKEAVEIFPGKPSLPAGRARGQAWVVADLSMDASLNNLMKIMGYFLFPAMGDDLGAIYSGTTKFILSARRDARKANFEKFLSEAIGHLLTSQLVGVSFENLRGHGYLQPKGQAATFVLGAIENFFKGFSRKGFRSWLAGRLFSAREALAGGSYYLAGFALTEVVDRLASSYLGEEKYRKFGAVTAMALLLPGVQGMIGTTMDLGKKLLRTYRVQGMASMVGGVFQTVAKVSSGYLETQSILKAIDKISGAVVDYLDCRKSEELERKIEEIEASRGRKGSLPAAGESLETSGPSPSLPRRALAKLFAGTREVFGALHSLVGSDKFQEALWILCGSSLTSLATLQLTELVGYALQHFAGVVL